jgi:hypothetical protein
MFAVSRIDANAESLTRFFAFIIALAIGEAFKQFVSQKDVRETKKEEKDDNADKKDVVPDKPDSEDKRHIHWDRLPALIAFMLLIVPFFHGICRLFYDRYEATLPLPSNYAEAMLIDFCAITILAATFFVLSRALPWEDSARFYQSVCCLLGFDLLWFVAEWKIVHCYQPETFVWAGINSVMFVVLGAILYADRALPTLFASRNSRLANTPRNVLDFLRNPIVLSVLMAVRTICDYGFNFPFYFPRS